jgi:phage shock protein A
MLRPQQAQQLASLLQEALSAEDAALAASEGLAARLRAIAKDADRLVAAARESLTNHDDAAARKHLEAKAALLARVPALEAEALRAADRLASARRSAAVLRGKVAEVDAIVRRAAASADGESGGRGSGAAADYEAYVEPPPGRSADPLLARFEALEREEKGR